MADQGFELKSQEWFLLAASLDWKSFDPFDLLLSPYLKKLPSFSPFFARLAIQLGKASNASIRRILKILPHEEAKTLSDYLESAILFSKGNKEWAKAYLVELAQRLIKKSIQAPHGFGWGLEFPYTTRFVNVPARTPNIYQTINAIKALSALPNVNVSQEFLEFALQGCRFIIEDLGIFERGKSKWFRYWPGLDAPIINIQASIAGVFSYIGALTGQQNYLELSNYAMQTVVNSQNENGSWYYSVDGKANFIDGFHTGFVLQGLTEYAINCSKTNVSRVNNAIQKGFEFFKCHLINESGIPLGLADGRVSLDGQNFAQCVQTFAICSQSSADLKAGLLSWQKMIEIPSLKEINYPKLRWTYGPAVLATAHLFNAISRNSMEVKN